MSESIPMNDLDKAIMAFMRSKSALPEVLRCIREGDLYLLVPFHPEVANETMELKNGMPMPFARIQTKHGVAVVAFSSEARVEEGLKKGNVPPHTYMAAMMPALQALEIVGKMNLNLTVNKSCATGELTLPPKALRDMADGTALKPAGIDPAKTEQLRLDIVNPADYPTDLLQPVFELLRKHKHFRAAWIFTRTFEGQPAPAHKPYYILVLMEPRDAVIFHDFNLVAQSAKGKHEVNVSLTQADGPEYIASLFRQVRPFYVAADYQPPAAGTNNA
jgi:hypothetical protein